MSVAINRDNPELVARVAESYARTITGLALDGISGMLSMYLEDDEEEGENG
jgi:hypothetical protein